MVDDPITYHSWHAPGPPSCIDVADSICNDAAGPAATAGPAAGAAAGSGESSLRPTLGTCARWICPWEMVVLARIYG